MKFFRGIVAAVAVCVMGSSVLAEEPFKDVLGTLEPESKFYQDFFPEPLGVSSLTIDDEITLGTFYGSGEHIWQSLTELRVEKSFKLLTLELNIPFTHVDFDDDSENAFGPIAFAARHPVYQWISETGMFDYTVGARVEYGLSVDDELAADNEFVIGAYQALAIGQQFSIQALTQYSFLIGPELGGHKSFEYSFIFGYNFDIPTTLRIERIIPIIEFDGETGVGGKGQGPSTFTGVAGANFNFERMRWGQPKLLLGYVFPLNDNAEDLFDWGLTASFILQF